MERLCLAFHKLFQLFGTRSEFLQLQQRSALLRNLMHMIKKRGIAQSDAPRHNCSVCAANRLLCSQLFETKAISLTFHDPSFNRNSHPDSFSELLLQSAPEGTRIVTQTTTE